MSKENNNLRLLGSPVNLSYRNKKKDDKKNIRNRPRSALQNSCITPDNQERYKRPFSADTKDRGQSTRNLLKAFSAELLQSYNNSPASAITVKVLAPTTDLLGGKHSPHSPQAKDLCSNASDYGSEDTYISLGTKIKAKAQISPKPKNTNTKNFLKYRNIAKKAHKPMETPIQEDLNNDYNMEVKITERQRSPSPQRNKNMFNERSFSPTLKTRPYESYFIPLDPEKKESDDSLLGRVSFGYNVQAEVEEAIDTYSRRLTATRQQLSLVEEESTQDLESVPSQNCVTPENSLEHANDGDKADELAERNAFVVDTKVDYPQITQNFLCETRTYTSFYEDFQGTSVDPFRSKMSSTAILTDTSSKDSGYPDSGPNDEKSYKPIYSLPTSILKKSSSHTNIDDQPKSLDSASTSSNGQYKTFPMDRKEQWSEPLNHSRLLYKDFFLKKEGHIALPRDNSPTKSIETYPEDTDSHKAIETKPEVVINEDLQYPPYLANSTTKAYTSKVIEDYKKELEAINSLHELTLKDLKTDAISPTPLNIDKMFEENSSNFSDSKKESGKSSPETPSSAELPINNKTSYEIKQRRDIAKISTKELIQNYLKVKEGDIKEYLPKNKKVNNVPSKFDNIPSRYKQDWNNKKTGILKSSTQVNIRNQTQKHHFPAPTSARLDGINNDKDIDSWMSMSAPSPRILELDNETVAEPEKTEPEKTEPNIIENIVDVAKPAPQPKDPVPKELNANSTVLDIYSMLKEIESYGDNPVTSVTSVATVEIPEETKAEEERNVAPKDNFLEIFQFLEKVEQSANDALSVVTSTTPQTIPKLETLLKLPPTELAQRLVTASLQLEERSCCIALLQESLTNHKEQMITKVSNLEKQSLRNIAKVKLECEDTIKRHQNFIDQLISDKKTLNHRIEQLVDERRSLEERWRRAAQSLEERYKLELRNQHDKMVASQQVARQRWVRQKAEKIKELTVKGLEGELREMAERQQKEVSDLKMHHAEQLGRNQAKHQQEMELLRRTLEDEKEQALVKERHLASSRRQAVKPKERPFLKMHHTERLGRNQAKHQQEMELLRRRLEDEKEQALVKERHLASSRLEKQILELELTYQEQRTRLVAEMRAENERVASGLTEKERAQREEIDKWKQEQEKIIAEKKLQMERDMETQMKNIEEQLQKKQKELEKQFEQQKKDFELEQQMVLKRRVSEIAAQHKIERDREIEKAIENMEAEAQAGRKELQEAIRRNKEQYEAELKELAETEQATLRRYQEAQARVRQTEDRCAELEVQVNQLETRNRVLTEKNTSLESRGEEIRASCEAAWRGKIDALHQQIDELNKTHEEQMHQLYAKVKVAVARKDSAIQALTREAAKYQEKITTLEQKLQQQRKDFLKTK